MGIGLRASVCLAVGCPAVLYSCGCVWSFVLPPKAANAFRFAFRPGGGGGGTCDVPYAVDAFWVEVLAFGLLACSAARCPGYCAGPYDPFSLLRCFLLLGGCPWELVGVTRKVVAALREAGFLVSPSRLWSLSLEFSSWVSSSIHVSRGYGLIPGPFFACSPSGLGWLRQRTRTTALE